MCHVWLRCVSQKKKNFVWLRCGKKKSNCCQSIVISYESSALSTDVIELKKIKVILKSLQEILEKNKVLAKKGKRNPIAISSLSCLAEMCF